MSGYPTYPEDFWMPPSSRTSVNTGLTAWFAVGVYVRGRTPDALATEFITAWMSLPWPTDEVGLFVLLTVLLWMVGGSLAGGLVRT